MPTQPLNEPAASGPSQEKLFKKISASARNALRLAKKWIITSALILLVSIAIGAANPESFDIFFDALKSLAQEIKEKSFAGITVFIFFNNLKAAAFAVILGPAFALVPTMQATVNGLLIGAVVHKIAATNGIFTVVLGLLPHGVFEIPAMLIAWGLGIWLGLWPFKSTGPRLKERVKLAAMAFLYYVIPLLLGAAIIEGFLISMVRHGQAW